MYQSGIGVGERLLQLETGDMTTNATDGGAVEGRRKIKRSRKQLR